MNIICMIFFCILLLCSFFFYRTLKHPAVIFNLLWSVLILVSIVGYPGITPPNAQIYGIFLLGGIVFNVSAFFANYVKTNKSRGLTKSNHGVNNRNGELTKSNYGVNDRNGELTKSNYGVNDRNGVLTKSNHGVNNRSKFMFEVSAKQLKILMLVQLILMVYYIVKAIGLVNDLLAGFSYGNIRSYYYSDQYLSSQIEYLLLTYVFDPLLTLTQILFGINLFTKSIKKSVSVMMLINILLRTLISGGRMLLLELVVIIAVCYLVIGKTKKFTRKQKIGMLVLVLVATCIAVMITTERGREGTFFEKIQEMLVVNFTGSFTFLEHLMNTGKFIDTSFGAASFAGIIDPIIVVVRSLGITDALTKQIEIGNITQNFVLIGTYSYNAMPTMYYYFMTDFGQLGNFIMPLFLGVVSTRIYKKLMNNPSIKSLVLYLFCILVIVESPMTWLPFKSSFMLAVLISIKLFSKKRRAVK